MNAQVKSLPTGSRNRSIREMIVPADVAVLNAHLASNNLGSDEVIAIMLVQGTTFAPGTGDRFRVLYWA
ncbi:hypothetical protein [Methylovirgula sp. 4M-Z18]|uniref:hypothetical protein n=1 Tax=Methylovirgula sp. 4M-Z18 TaxID=2293567 RepID=UPI000E2F04A9|nr:hypothetical protein [Methylovirgula sp. 4M-Z18]RFB79828.1 hypothetical protein DYH55_10270 [Methylovirgula sp. 4M-Z18]